LAKAALPIVWNASCSRDDAAMLLRPVLPIVLGAALASGCGTSSSTVSVSASPDPVKCQVALAAPPTLDAGGGTGSLAITTQPECSWEVSTNVNWISSLSPASGQGTANVSFRVAANDGSSERDGMLVVNGEQARVSQRAPCRYDVSPSNQNVGSNGGAGSLGIATASECSWTAVAEVGWIAITSAAGSGNGNVRFSVASNSEGARTGSIAVGGQRATIAQAGASAPPACNATISPTSQNVGAAGGAGAPVTVSSANTCQWTASSNASWITVTAGATGTGNGTVTFSVAANSGAGRTGTLTIAGRAFTVTQSASGSPPPPPPASCSYSISPNNAKVPVLGGTGSVNVSTTSACSWTAASNVVWITIASGGSGTGDGRVGYVVLPNVGSSRSGTLTIAGQTFTVTQAGLVCSYSISPNNVKVTASAGTGSTNVTTNSACSWMAASDESWIVVTSGSSGAGDGTVTFSYTQNNDRRGRKGTLTVAGKKFTVEQDGNNSGDDDDDD
jgi:hypothetical protein